MRARSIRKEAPERGRVSTISIEVLLVSAVALVSLVGVPGVSAEEPAGQSAQPLALTLDEAIGIALGEIGAHRVAAQLDQGRTDVGFGVPQHHIPDDLWLIRYCILSWKMPHPHLNSGYATFLSHLFFRILRLLELN